MIFSKDQAALILAGKQSAVLLPASRDIKVGKVRQLRRRTMRHDENGTELGFKTDTVLQGEGEDRQPVLLTVLEAQPVSLEHLSAQQAQWCGFKTVTGCRAAWEMEHTQPVAKLVRFVLGDLRDKDRYPARGIGYTTVSSLAVEPGVPAVPFDEQYRQTHEARKVETQRLADPDIKLRMDLARILEDWQINSGGRSSTRALGSEVRALRHRLQAIDRKLGEARIGTVLRGHVDHPDFVSRRRRKEAA